MRPRVFAGASTGARLKRKRACTSAPFDDSSLLLPNRAAALRACTDTVRSSVADGAGRAADARTDALAAADAYTADMMVVSRRAECEADEVLRGSPAAADGVAAPCSGAPEAAAAAPLPAAAGPQVRTQPSERRGSPATLAAAPGALASPPLGARQLGDPCGSGAGAPGGGCLSPVPGAATVAEGPAPEHGIAAQPDAEHDAAAGASGAAGVSIAPGPAASLPATAFYRRWRMSQVSSSPSRPVSLTSLLSTLYTSCTSCHTGAATSGCAIIVHTAAMPAVRDRRTAHCTCTCALPNNHTHGLRVRPQVERYVLRLLGAVQRRRGAVGPAPYQPFARQDAAFCWADAHPLAAELRCAPSRIDLLCLLMQLVPFWAPCICCD